MMYIFRAGMHEAKNTNSSASVELGGQSLPIMRAAGLLCPLRKQGHSRRESQKDFSDEYTLGTLGLTAHISS